ncbi:MAG: peptidylprolyl isomerase [Clostridia bacterium]|nr:peptidylprolyl isomerase [Clostridia bacterium]
MALIVILVFLLALLGKQAFERFSPTPGPNSQTATLERVTIETSRGVIEIELYPELMPLTVANFQKLVESDFYDGLTFHRVEDWVVQGGDPLGNGTGGPGWTIKLEVHPELKNVRGALAMARGPHPDSAGSQFYILKEDAPWLDGDYAVFGMVTAGMEVVDSLQPGDKMISIK